MAELTFTWNRKQLGVFKGRRVETAAVMALRKAGGDAIRAARAESKRGVRTRTRIRAGYLSDKALPLAFPSGRSSSLRDGTLAWRMDVSGKEVPLGEYPRRQTRRGVSVEVQRGKRVLLTSAFLAKAKTGRLGVFLRPTTKRYPMGHRLGPSVADNMADGRVPDAALRRAIHVMDSAFTRLLPLELAKLKK